MKGTLQLSFHLQIKKAELSEDGSRNGAKFNKSNCCQHQHLLFRPKIKFVQLQQLMSISTLTKSNNEINSTSTQILLVCNHSESCQNQHGIELRVQQQNTLNNLGTSDWKWPRDLENKLFHSYNIQERGSRTLLSFAKSSDCSLTTTSLQNEWILFFLIWSSFQQIMNTPKSQMTRFSWNSFQFARKMPCKRCGTYFHIFKMKHSFSHDRK